jgi:hypothetical protein
LRPLVCAFVGGFAVMGAEMAFARQAAPWFDNSLPVWAVLISVLLSALSVGAAWGGLRTLKGRPPSFPGPLLGLAAAALVLTAFVLPPLLAAAAGARQPGVALAVLAAGAALVLAALCTVAALAARGLRPAVDVPVAVLLMVAGVAANFGCR